MRGDQMALMIPIIAVLGPILCIVVHIITKSVSKVLCHWRDASLKIRLVEAGMSADEIVQVLNANSHPDSRKSTPAQSRVARTNKPPVSPKPEPKSMV